MESFIEVLKSSLNLIITALFVSATVMLGLIAQRAVNPATNGLAEYLEYSDKVTSVNNSLVTGNFVRKACTSYNLNGFCSAVVYTERCKNGFYIFDQIDNLSSNYYINPASEFFVSALHDTDMQVVQVRFIEKDLDFSNYSSVVVSAGSIEADSISDKNYSDVMGELHVPLTLSKFFDDQTKQFQYQIEVLKEKQRGKIIPDNLRRSFSTYNYLYYLNEALRGYINEPST